MPNKNTDEQLRKLLRLKRFEVPSEDEWLNFDRVFENRKFSAVKDPWFRGRVPSFSFILNFKHVLGSMGVLCLFLILLVATNRDRGMFERGEIYATKGGDGKPVAFASDDMFGDSNYGIHLGTCSMNYYSDGVEYVRDTLIFQNKGSELVRM
jgi:hypothetical protein